MPAVYASNPHVYKQSELGLAPIIGNSKTVVRRSINKITLRCGIGQAFSMPTEIQARQSIQHMHMRLNIFLVALVFALVGCSNSGTNTGDGAKPQKHPGHAVYRKYCRSCHQGGLAGSPIYGSKEDWEPRIAKGNAVLLENTIKGIPPGMPKKGMCHSCTDEELEEAIDYMIQAVADEQSNDSELKDS